MFFLVGNNEHKIPVRVEKVTVNMPAENPEYAVDDQTGRSYKLEKESAWDLLAAIFSAVYLLAALGFFLWQLADVGMGQMTLLGWLGYAKDDLIGIAYQLPLYAFLGGAIGGTVRSLRGFVSWHLERKAFGGRFIWKHIMAPWMGATLGVIIYAVFRSGVGLLDTGAGDANPSSSLMLVMLALGILSGYGSEKAFVWLDAQATRIFRVEVNTRVVPKVAGKPQEEAEAILMAAGFKPQVWTEPVSDVAMAGRVIQQDQPPKTGLPSGSEVGIKVAGKP